MPIRPTQLHVISALTGLGSTTSTCETTKQELKQN